jgi:hypothetical protein
MWIGFTWLRIRIKGELLWTNATDIWVSWKTAKRLSNTVNVRFKRKTVTRIWFFYLLMHYFGDIVSYCFFVFESMLTLSFLLTHARGPKLWKFTAPDYDRQFTASLAYRNWRAFLLLGWLSFEILSIISYCETTQRFWKLGQFPSSAKGWGRHRLCCFRQNVEVKCGIWTDLRGGKLKQQKCAY